MSNGSIPVSGLYTLKIATGTSLQDLLAMGAGAWEYLSEERPPWEISDPRDHRLKLELRLDVDRTYPLQVASLTVREQRLIGHWIVNLLPASPPLEWSGKVSYGWGALSRLRRFEHLDVKVETDSAGLPRKARIFLSGHPHLAGSSTELAPHFLLEFKSPYFRTVEIQVDKTDDAKHIATETDPYGVTGNPDPAQVVVPDPINLENAYGRAGILVNRKESGTPIPYDEEDFGTDEAGDDMWSDAELHFAMEKCWAPYGGPFPTTPKWALWALYIYDYEFINEFGVMFDAEANDLTQRQGLAVFQRRFESYYEDQNLPASADPDAWFKRCKFFVTIHEIGHTFNLAHSWEKDIGTPWVTMSNNKEARSFMNYPWRVGGTNAALDELDREKLFFQDFEYRFLDEELLFLRHAPEPFVQMGNSAWKHNHAAALEEAASPDGNVLTLGLARHEPVFEFLEPIHLDLILSRETEGSLILDPGILSGGDRLTLLIQREGQPVRVLLPYKRVFMAPRTLAVGQPVARSLFVSAGSNGWLLDEPGSYTIQARLRLGEQDVVSRPLQVRIETPRNASQERIAADYFTDQVGRILALQASRVPSLADGRRVLERFEEEPELQGLRAALHARYALYKPLATRFKRLEAAGESAQGDETASKWIVRGDPAEPERAEARLNEIMYDPTALEGFGYGQFIERSSWFARWLWQRQNSEAAESMEAHLHRVLEDHNASGILPAFRPPEPPWLRKAEEKR